MKTFIYYRIHGTTINNSRTKEAIKRRKQAAHLIGVNAVCLRALDAVTLLGLFRK